MTKLQQGQKPPVSRVMFDQMKNLLPGIIVCLIIILLGIYLADLIGDLAISIGILSEGSASPISGIFVAIVIGIIIRNTLGLKDILASGVSFSVKYALRAGIILLGLRLSL